MGTGCTKRKAGRPKKNWDVEISVIGMTWEKKQNT